mmetsp:Transcript_6311/g.19002  ORF Transcript_6311/g.19002 Transcript_6311/m.19002 type:complete len:216 (-) Transcript_6311:102-749(-)
MGASLSAPTPSHVVLALRSPWCAGPWICPLTRRCREAPACMCLKAAPRSWPLAVEEVPPPSARRWCPARDLGPQLQLARQPPPVRRRPRWAYMPRLLLGHQPPGNLEWLLLALGLPACGRRRLRTGHIHLRSRKAGLAPCGTSPSGTTAAHRRQSPSADLVLGPGPAMRGGHLRGPRPLGPGMVGRRGHERRKCCCGEGATSLCCGAWQDEELLI